MSGWWCSDLHDCSPALAAYYNIKLSVTHFVANVIVQRIKYSDRFRGQWLASWMTAHEVVVANLFVGGGHHFSSWWFPIAMDPMLIPPASVLKPVMLIWQTQSWPWWPPWQCPLLGFRQLLYGTHVRCLIIDSIDLLMVSLGMRQSLDLYTSDLFQYTCGMKGDLLGLTFETLCMLMWGYISSIGKN